MHEHHSTLITRPSALTRVPWIMAQTWHDLLFAHWPLPPEAIRPLLPAQLSLDTWEGEAWVGVIPFRLSDIRLRGMPPLPLVSAFPEINVRTYVRVNGKPGVYFFSLDADNVLGIALAKWWFRLPYYRARICFARSGNWFHFASERTEERADQAAFCGSYCPCSSPLENEPGSVEEWLTERYCYFCVSRKGRTYCCDISHEPWRLQKALACLQGNTMALPHGIELPHREPLLHYAHEMTAQIAPLRRVRMKGEG